MTFGLALLLAGCAAAPPAPLVASDGSGAGSLVLFDAGELVEHAWHHVKLRGATRYTVGVSEGVLGVRAVGQESASGLAREMEVDARGCGDLEWRWRVDALQSGADLTDRALEDVAASLMLLFGDPGPMFAPKPVPTLRYVWSSARHSVGEVVDSPYLPGVVRSLVVHSGIDDLGRWVTERRNPVADYTLAFGEAPTSPVHGVVLFTDNDQTREPVESWYAWVRLECPAAG